MKYRGFRDLKVYQLSYQLALETFEITKEYPKEELYFNGSNKKIIQISSF